MLPSRLRTSRAMLTPNSTRPTYSGTSRRPRRRPPSAEVREVTGQACRDPAGRTDDGMTRPVRVVDAGVTNHRRSDVLFGSKSPTALVTPEQALPGRPAPAFEVPATHAVLGTPLKGPWPEGT